MFQKPSFFYHLINWNRIFRWVIVPITKYALFCNFACWPMNWYEKRGNVIVMYVCMWVYPCQISQTHSSWTRDRTVFVLCSFKRVNSSSFSRHKMFCGVTWPWTNYLLSKRPLWKSCIFLSILEKTFQDITISSAIKQKF